MVRARVERRGDLAFIVTEHGQRAVVPWDSLCRSAAKLGLELENVDCKEFRPARRIVYESFIAEGEGGEAEEEAE